jgi:hypothetical protein
VSLLERIIQQVKSLTDREQRELAAILEELKKPAESSSTEGAFENQLAAEGSPSLSQALPDDSPIRIGSPPAVDRQPLSEILQDRR